MTTVILYWEPDFQGPSLTLHSSDANLSDDIPGGVWPYSLLDPALPWPLGQGWDNQVSSIKIFSDDPNTYVEFYNDPGYQGSRLTLKPGEHPNLQVLTNSYNWLHNEISSVYIPGNLIKNGSFEEGPDAGAYLSLGPGSKDISDWTVIQSPSSPLGLTGAIDYIGSDWVAADGNRSLDLNGTPGVGGVLQEFDTRPGQQYHVTFKMAGHHSGLNQEMLVSAEGQSAVFSFDPKPDQSQKNLGWETKEWWFTAYGYRTTLAFVSQQTDYLYGGPALDDVWVVDVNPNNTSSPTQQDPTTTITSPSTTTTPDFVTLGGIAR